MKGLVHPIRVYGDPVLAKKTKPVAEITEEISQLIADMKATMLAQQGLGLSANQIGVPLSIIVVNPRGAGIDSEPYAVINPKLVKTEGLQEREEGCLSIPGLSEVVARPAKVVVKGLNEEGKPIEIKAEGLLARVFCHEIDHLEGIFYVNRLGKARFSLLSAHLKEIEKEAKSPKG